MRLNKGDLVEVLSKKEISFSSWSCAEIISGNGHTYSVRYSSFPMAREEAVERVPRKAIRPCPPPEEGANVWVAGDLAEVYHNYSWKQAKITKIVGDDSCIARILGSPLDVMVSQSHIRKRQAWHDGNWFVLGKQATEVSGALSIKRQTSARIKPDNVKTEDQRPDVLLTSSRQLKRVFHIESPNSEARKVPIKKRKVVEKLVRCSPLLARTTHMDQLQEIELHRIGLNLRFLTTNTEVSTNDFGAKENNRIPGTSNRSHTDSCAASSVGSTGSTNDFSEMPRRNVEGEDYCSDAESYTGQGHEGVSSFPKYHRLEVLAYRCIIRELYASGPLSWEDETQLANIRVALHISNDEYLLELRNLLTDNKNISI